MARYIGIDGGASVTRFVVWDSAEGVIASSRIEEPSAYRLVGVESVVATFRAGISLLGQNLNVDGIGAGLSGAGRPHDREVLEGVLRGLGVTNHVLVAGDAMAALYGALPDAVGVLVIAGTGSIALARNADGETGRAGGWGHFFPEAGSGFWFVTEAWQAALDARDGMGKETALTERLCKYFGLENCDNVVSLYYSGFEKRRVASGCPVVLSTAADGDVVAQEIVMKGARRLSQMVQAAASSVGFEGSVGVSTAGGVFQDHVFMKAFQTTLREVAPRISIQPPLHEPVVGAALMIAAMSSIDQFSET